MELAGDDGFVLLKDLLKLHLIESRVDIGHKGCEVVLVIGKGTDNDVPISNLISLESLQDTIGNLSRCESDCSLSILQSYFFTKFSLTPEIVLHYRVDTLIAASISYEFSGVVTTLMKIFLSVSSFSPKAYALATLN